MDQVLEEAVDRWQEAHLIDATTAASIRTYEDADRAVDRSSPPAAPADQRGVLPGGRAGFVAEGLAYLGAALAIGAGLVLFSELWGDLSGPARTLVAAFGTLALGGAAATLDGSGADAVRRLRSLLAALAVVGVAATVGVGLAELTDLDADLVALLAGVSGLAAAVPVHLARPSWPTTLVLGGSLLTTVIAAEVVAGFDDRLIAIGATVAGLGLAWAALGWAGIAHPQSAFEVTGLLAGGAGIQALGFEGLPVAAPVIGLLVAGGVLAVGVVEERSGPAVLGGLGITVFAPQLVIEVFGDTIGGPLALFVGGLALIGVAITVLRQRSEA